MRRRRLEILCLVWALACWACSGPSRAPAGAPASAAPTAAPTRAALPAETLEILSLISVEHEVDLLAQRDGVVRKVFRDQGAIVARGDVLARLDDRDLMAELDRAKADVRVAEYNVKYNEAELKAKQANLRRHAELLRLGLTSQADYEKAEFEAKGAEYDLAAWHVTVERTQAEVRKHEADLDKTRLRAPFSGVVARRHIRDGQSVLKDDKCFRLSELRPLQVRFLVPEGARRRPVVGDAVNVVTVGEDGHPLRAVIRRVSPVVDPGSDSVEVMAELSGPDLAGLRPGTAVRILWTAQAASAP